MSNLETMAELQDCLVDIRDRLDLIDKNTSASEAAREILEIKNQLDRERQRGKALRGECVRVAIEVLKECADYHGMVLLQEWEQRIADDIEGI